MYKSAVHRLACAALLALFAQLGVPLAGEEPPARPDFSGSWELDPERSDDPRERVDEATRGLVEPPRSRTARGGGGSGSDGVRRALREQVEALVAGPRVITIRHDEPELGITSALPETPFDQTLYTDGRSFTWSGAAAEATAGWQRGGRLVVELAGTDGRPVRETWELVADGSRILVTTEVVFRRPVPTIRVQRVYDRVEIVPWAVPE